MMNYKVNIAALLIAFSSMASADIIDVGTYTTDTGLGLDYLDVGLVHDNYGAFAAGIVYDGRTWMLATADQLASTWSDATGLALTAADIFSVDNDMGSAASAILHSLFDGATMDGGGSAGESVVGDYSISGYYNFILGGSLAVHDATWYDSHYQSDTTGYHGAWLVAQSVPEPGTLALLGIGLAGIGFSRRKRKV